MLGEHHVRNVGAEGSNPFISTMETKQARQCAGPVLRSGSEGIRTVYCSSTTP